MTPLKRRRLWRNRYLSLCFFKLRWAQVCITSSVITTSPVHWDIRALRYIRIYKSQWSSPSPTPESTTYHQNQTLYVYLHCTLRRPAWWHSAQYKELKSHCLSVCHYSVKQLIHQSVIIYLSYYSIDFNCSPTTIVYNYKSQCASLHVCNNWDHLNSLLTGYYWRKNDDYK